MEKLTVFDHFKMTVAIRNQAQPIREARWHTVDILSRLHDLSQSFILGRCYENWVTRFIAFRGLCFVTSCEAPI